MYNKTSNWIRIFAIAFFSLLVMQSCKHENRCDTPIGAAACSIEPNSPNYNHLNNVGGYEYITGGNHGIFVIRTSLYEFAAFERTCPHDHDAAVKVADGWDGTVLECPVCGSMFNSYANGTPLNGSTTSCPLYEYGTKYENGILYIF